VANCAITPNLLLDLTRLLQQNGSVLTPCVGWAVNAVGRQYSHKFGYGLLDAGTEYEYIHTRTFATLTAGWSRDGMDFFHFLWRGNKTSAKLSHFPCFWTGQLLYLLNRFEAKLLYSGIHSRPFQKWYSLGPIFSYSYCVYMHNYGQFKVKIFPKIFSSNKLQTQYIFMGPSISVLLGREGRISIPVWTVSILQL
jgi:hypothetical protein